MESELVDDIIPVEARVVHFTPDAAHDSYDDGGFAFYDATELELLSPSFLQGRRLRIYLDPAAPDVLRTPDTMVAFSVKRNRLLGGRRLFAGALSNVRPLI